MALALFNKNRQFAQPGISGAYINSPGFFRRSAETLSLFFASIRKLPGLRRYPVRQVFLRQIYFTGIEALFKITAIGVLMGLVIVTQITWFAGTDATLAAKALIWTDVKELGPLFAAFVVIARSCGAVASELASMRVNGEIESLFVMGIDPVAYLLTPRLAGISISVFVLIFYFQVFSVIGGLAAAAVFAGIPFHQYLIRTYELIGFDDLGISLLKGFVFGLAIPAVSIYQGFRVIGPATEVPKATTAAVMESLFLVLAADAAIDLVLR